MKWREHMDDMYWNDKVDFYKIARNEDTDELEFYNLLLYFSDSEDEKSYALSLKEMIYQYDTFEEAFMKLRFITCEVTVDTEDEYLLEIIKLPPYEGSSFGYKITNEDGTGCYQWEEGYDYSNRLFNASQKAMSKYYKLNNWVAALASNRQLSEMLGNYQVKEYRILSRNDKGWSILFDNDIDYKEIDSIAQAIHVEVKNDEGEFVFVYYWKHDERRIEVRLLDYETIVEYENAEDIVIALKEEILGLVKRHKAPIAPGFTL